nr:MAG TPA: hypothetical protein [Caudoviricetes sp.]
MKSIHSSNESDSSLFQRSSSIISVTSTPRAAAIFPTVAGMTVLPLFRFRMVCADTTALSRKSR